jgi:CubicO group peptidase (beta-lactamase class C family)
MLDYRGNGLGTFEEQPAGSINSSSNQRCEQYEHPAINDLSRYQDVLKRYLESACSHWNIPGVCLEISANGFRVGASAGTPVIGSGVSITRDARFRLGEIGNMLVSLSILQFRARGLIELEAPIATYLTELRGTPIGDEVKVWHLMSHAGGQCDIGFADLTSDRVFEWPEVVEMVKRAALRFMPGTVFSYSPLGMAILHVLLGRISDTAIIDVIRSQILDPLQLGMGSSRLGEISELDVASHVLVRSTQQICACAKRTRQPLAGSPTDVAMSLPDLTTLVESILDRREAESGDDSRVACQVALALQHQTMAIPHVTSGSGFHSLPNSAGLGCAQYRSNWYGKNGPLAGQSLAVRYHSSHRMAVAVATNLSAPRVCHTIVDELLHSLGQPSIPPEPSIIGDPCTSHDLEGDYLSSSEGVARITSLGKDVVCEFSVGSTSSLRLRMAMDDYNRWIVCAGSSQVPLGFFREPESGIPCLMVGPLAYKKSFS